jgi:hypothetical protein
MSREKVHLGEGFGQQDPYVVCPAQQGSPGPACRNDAPIRPMTSLAAAGNTGACTTVLIVRTNIVSLAGPVARAGQFVCSGSFRFPEFDYFRQFEFNDLLVLKEGKR